jgi:hypothetical protein
MAISSNQSEQVQFSPIVVAACTRRAIYTDISEPANLTGLPLPRGNGPSNCIKSRADE